MTSHFASAFPSPDYLKVGCTNGFTLQFTSAQAVTDFLPSGGSARALTGNLINPGGTYSNTLAGQLVGLTLSVQFDLTDANFSAAGTHLQDLVVTTGTFVGWTVAQVLAEANNVLGGCASTYTAAQLNSILTAINENYDNGTSDNGILHCGTSARFGNFSNRNEVASGGLEAKVYPNPFYSSTSIRLSSTEDIDLIQVEIYNVAGERVALLYNDKLGAGESKEFFFNASEFGDAIYFYRVTGGGKLLNGKLILIK